MQSFVLTLEGVSKINIKGKHYADTDLLDSLGQQQASARNWMRCLCDAGGHWPGTLPYLEPVLKNLVFAFDKYQHKNMLILYTLRCCVHYG